jgi:hypothetical protein
MCPWLLVASITSPFPVSLIGRALPGVNFESSGSILDNCQELPLSWVAKIAA